MSVAFLSGFECWARHTSVLRRLRDLARAKLCAAATSLRALGPHAPATDGAVDLGTALHTLFTQVSIREAITLGNHICKRVAAALPSRTARTMALSAGIR